MPYAFMHINKDKHFALADAVGVIRMVLPEIVAEELSVEGRAIHEGGLSPKEVMIWPGSGEAAVNGKDIELLIFAHPFPERVANLEERKDAIIRKLAYRLDGVERTFTFAVCIVMTPMAYGETRVLGMMKP